MAVLYCQSHVKQWECKLSLKRKEVQQNSVSKGKKQKYTHVFLVLNYSHYGNQLKDYLVSSFGNTGTFKGKGFDC